LRRGEAMVQLGCPLSDHPPADTEEAMFFERGCLWHAPVIGKMLRIDFSPPLMGKPLLVRPVENRELLDHVWLSCQLTSEDKILLENQRPFFLQEIWAGALSLVPVGKPGDPRPPIALEVGSTRTGETSMVDGRAMHTVWAGVRMSPGTKLVEGQLFDVVLRTSDGQQHSVARMQSSPSRIGPTSAQSISLTSMLAAGWRAFGANSSSLGRPPQ
jgi:hypothetical protein